MSSDLGPAFGGTRSDPATCRHPPERQFAWAAAAPEAPSGELQVVMCFACGAVIRGAAEDIPDQVPPRPEKPKRKRRAATS